MKRVVIIGSGIGGLSCGCILAQNGFEVTVLEQGVQIGGCLQCFKRGNAVFDTGMHYIGDAAEGQTLNTILKYIGIDDAVEMERLDTAGYDVIVLHGKQYKIANGRKAFVNTLAEEFPESREELARYYDLVKSVAQSAVIHSLNRNVDVSVNTEFQTRSVDDVIDSTVSNPLLRDVLTGILPLYAGKRQRTPFYTHALIADSYDNSAMRIVGGSNRMAEAMANKIADNGGRVIARQKAVEIVCDEKHAVGVRTDDGNYYLADIVISAIHPASTIQLVKSNLLRTAYRQRIEGLKNTTSAFTVYLKFKKDAVPYMNHNLYYYRGESTWNCEEYDSKSWPKYLLYMHFCHERNPKFAQSGEIMTYMNYDELSQWHDTTVGHRGSEYEEWKRRKAQQLIAALEEQVPGISNDIDGYYASTPLTLRDYTGVPEGAMYGVARDKNEIGIGSVSTRTRVPNLYITGQSIILHGMLGTLAGSLLTCSEILSLDEIFAQLTNAQETKK